MDREYWRLLALLRRKAVMVELYIELIINTSYQDEGVRVSILLYKEVAAILRINSMHSKRVMLQHPNIRYSWISLFSISELYR